MQSNILQVLYTSLSCLLSLLQLLPISINAEPLSSFDYAFCEILYSRSDIPGSTQDSRITVTPTFGNLSVLVFEWRDRGYIGLKAPNGSKTFTSCNSAAISANACTESQRYLYLYENQSDMVYPGSLNMHYTGIAAQFLRNSSETFEYKPARRGIFCAMVSSVDPDTEELLPLFIGSPLFKQDAVNPYGRLPALDYPRLPFYGVLSLTYLAIGLAWLIKSGLHWREILPVQNYIGGVLLFIMVDYAFQFGYYEHYNLNDSSSKFLLGVCIMLNATRVALSFFLVLIVSLGYGVMKPSLGSEMRKCQINGVVMFICMIIFNIGLTFPAAQQNAFYSLICIVPLSLSLSYTVGWIMKALKATIMHLELRRQTYKVSMYRWLRAILIVFVVVGVIMLVASVSVKAGQYRDLFPWIITYMTSYWFFQDGWMSLLYFFAFLSIVLLWRPTSNNARYGLEELPENAEQAYDLEMPPVYDIGQDMKRRTATSPNSDGPSPSPNSGPNGGALSPRSARGNNGEVVFELSQSDNESPDDFLGRGVGNGNGGGTQLIEVDLSGASSSNNRNIDKSAIEDQRRKSEAISKLQ